MIAKLFGRAGRGLLLFFSAVGLVCSGACSSSAPTPADKAARPVPTSEISSTKTAPSLAPPSKASAASVSEVEARLLLNGLFRDAGLRVVNDREFRRGSIELTLDGYDPERGFGYEYISPEEQGTDVSAGEVLALRAETQILVIEGGTLDALEAVALRFLARISLGNPDAKLSR